MAVIMDGKALAEYKLQFQTNTARTITDARGRAPKLAIVVAGNNAASAVYVRNKIRACKKVGIETQKVELSEFCTEDDILWELKKLNGDPSVDGIIVQLPLPNGIDEKRIATYIDSSKDVDCFTDVNRGKLFDYAGYGLNPCTPEGVLELLFDYVQDDWKLTGKHVVIIGRSDIVGKPLAVELISAYDCTVTVCNSHTQNIEQFTKMADVLIVAIGKPKFVTMVKKGAVVIDVGINRLDDGTLCGDVDFEAVKDVAGHITPVPGGVGKMTVSCLIDNVLTAAADNK